MSDDVERVARALYEARLGGGNWEVMLAQRNAKQVTARWRSMARVAIAAMLEISSDAMALGESFIDCEYDFGRAWRAVLNKMLDDTDSVRPSTGKAEPPPTFEAAPRQTFPMAVGDTVTDKDSVQYEADHSFTLFGFTEKHGFITVEKALELGWLKPA